MSAYNEYLPDSAQDTTAEAAPESGIKGKNSSALVPQLRGAARRNRFISEGAKVLFDELTDLSFLDSVSKAFGVVDMAKKKLARELGVSNETMRRRAKELEEAGLVWTRTFYKSYVEITRWFIRGMANAQSELFRDYGDPSFGTSKSMERKERRPLPPRGIKGKFSKAGQGGPQNCADGETPVKPAENPIMTAGEGQKRPQPTVKNEAGLASDLTQGERQKRPQPTVKNGHSSRSELTELRSLETHLKENGECKEGEGPPDAGFGEWIKRLNKMNAIAWEKMEAQFVLQLKGAKTAQAKSLVMDKLEAVRERLYGPTVADVHQTSPAVKPGIVAAIATRQPTQEEIEEGKRFMAERKGAR